MDAAHETAPVERKRGSFLREPKLWFWCFGAAFAADGVEALVRSFSLPLWVRVPLCFLPLAPGFMFMRHHKRVVAKADELQLLIEREAFVFAFYGLIGILVCAHLLENAEVIPPFVWTTKMLIATAVGLYGVGFFWTRRRYR